MAYPITDRNGHTYKNRIEALEAIKYLQEDAEYLKKYAKAQDSGFVRIRVMENSNESLRYAEELAEAIQREELV